MLATRASRLLLAGALTLVAGAAVAVTGVAGATASTSTLPRLDAPGLHVPAGAGPAPTAAPPCGYPATIPAARARPARTGGRRSRPDRSRLVWLPCDDPGRPVQGDSGVQRGAGRPALHRAVFHHPGRDHRADADPPGPGHHLLVPVPGQPGLLQPDPLSPADRPGHLRAAVRRPHGHRLRRPG